MTRATPIGFIGLGDQGAPMAIAVAERGWDLHVWARRPSSLDALRGVPHVAHASIEELGRACGLVSLCLRTDDDLEEVLFEGGLAAAMPGGVVANHGTGSPERAAEVERRAAGFGIQVLDAPVSGGSDAARRRALTVMVGGALAAFEVYRPAFEAFGALIAHLGPAGSGQRAKLLNNLLFTSNLRNLEEALLLADELALDVPRLFELVAASSGGSRALELLRDHMPLELIEHNDLILAKDVAQFSATARQAGVEPSPLEERALLGVRGLGAAVRRLRAGDATRR